MKTKVQNNTIIFLLEESIFQRLKHKIGINNLLYPKDDNRLKLDVACYFVHLISYQQAKAINKSQHGFIFLNAKVVQMQHHNYKA